MQEAALDESVAGKPMRERGRARMCAPMKRKGQCLIIEHVLIHSSHRNCDRSSLGGECLLMIRGFNHLDQEARKSVLLAWTFDRDQCFKYGKQTNMANVKLVLSE